MTTPDLPKDRDHSLLDRQFAVVYTPRRQRQRFPENCVQIVGSREEAQAAGDPDKSLFPAMVYGPSRSSEGFRLYYLVEWIGP
ncbi:MAG: hypothetical protein KDI63_01845 [Gammaproteobacteria bacterium]|nr:hypothetical protein [Gammaproteobacteria bacterium]